MPIHIEELHSEVGLVAGELPLSAAQLDRIADAVAARLHRGAEAGPGPGGDTAIRSGAALPGPVEV